MVHWDSLISRDSIYSDADKLRRARGHARFGLLGSVFGTSFALFYLAIGHIHGALIIAACSMIFTLLPFMLGRICHLTLRTSANLYCFTLVTGFSSLVMVEGGISGHSIAWLCLVPLCAVLLADRIDGLTWALISLGITLLFGLCDLRGIEFPSLYPPQWAKIINVVGYAGLIPFAAMIGLVFETTRRNSFEQLHSANFELERKNAELRHLSSEKSEIMGIASHDLKTPLSIVSCYAELINRGGDNLSHSDITKFSSEIQTSAKRMLEIVTSFLNTQTIESGEFAIVPQSCSVDDIVEPLYGSFRVPAAKKQITLEGRIDIDLPQASGDPAAISQVLDNLISNAIKYSPHGSTILLRAEVEDGWVVTTVTDGGPGLSEEDQSHLFEKFTRLTPRPTGGESSNGLGLWIVRKLAEAMDGEVYCESQRGKGSTFGLRLPLWSDRPQAQLANRFNDGTSGRMSDDDATIVADLGLPASLADDSELILSS